MYYLNNSTSGIVYSAGYYQKNAASPPANYTTMNWSAQYSAAFVTDWAGSFVPNQREILPYGPSTLTSNPSLHQGYGY